MSHGAGILRNHSAGNPRIVARASCPCHVTLGRAIARPFGHGQDGRATRRARTILLLSQRHPEFLQLEILTDPERTSSWGLPAAFRGKAACKRKCRAEAGKLSLFRHLAIREGELNRQGGLSRGWHRQSDRVGELEPFNYLISDIACQFLSAGGIWPECD